MSASPAAGGWVPPVRPWPYVVGEPVCLLKAPVPAFALIVAVAEELRRVRLRVRVAPDGRSVQARPTWPIVLTAIGVVTGSGGFLMPKVTVAVESEGPGGVEISVRCRRGDDLGGLGGRVAKALNAVAWRLACSGVVLTVTPWERYAPPRKRKA